MSNIAIFTSEKRRDKDGGMKVFLRISHNGDRFLAATGLSTTGGLQGTMFPRDDRNRNAKRRRLDEILTAVEDVLIANARLTAAQVKPLVQQAINPARKTGQKLTHAIEAFAAQKSGRTVGLYKQTAKRVSEFDQSADLESVDAGWLKSFEQKCSATMRVNTVAIHLRNIRAVFNWAIDEGKTRNYPFARFRIRHEKTRKRSLSVEELRLLRDYPCEEFQKPYRDIFMLMFYLMGINAADLLHLTKKSLRGGRIEYTRAKTGKLYSIKVEPEAMEIIERYKGEKWLLSPLDRVGNHLNWLHRMNDALKNIGKKYRSGRKPEGEALFPDLSSYWSRHTWGTLAAEIDTPIDVIAHALGHSIPGLDVTSIYIRFNEKKVDAANRAVIDFVNRK
mgnify:CR=1 FL=1